MIGRAELKEMTEKFSDQERERFVISLLKIDAYWLQLFGNTEFNELHYSDLFTAMWLRREKSVHKTEACSFMTNISAKTAIKYLNNAVLAGYLIEVEDPKDKRSKLVKMSDDLCVSIENFIDYSISEFKHCC